MVTAGINGRGLHPQQLAVGPSERAVEEGIKGRPDLGLSGISGQHEMADQPALQTPTPAIDGRLDARVDLAGLHVGPERQGLDASGTSAP